MKKDQFFNLEVNFIRDDKVSAMMLELNGAESLGIYIALLLHLRTKDDYKASCSATALKVIARREGLNLDMVYRIIYDFELFEVDEQRLTFHSFYLDRVMQRLEERWRINAENGKKGGRPRKNKKSAETPMNKGRKPNETQEKRGEERISITTVSNSSNTGGAVAPVTAAAVARIRPAEEKGQRPLQPVRPWEELVDRLCESAGYMETAGMHSGLGMLFINHQKRILELFKAHIRLYAKNDELLFADDVKRYFSNFIAAGSTTCRKLREALLTEVNQSSGSNKLRFETLVGGKRMYLGHPIPADAPPRPDNGAVWNEQRHQWGH